MKLLVLLLHSTSLSKDTFLADWNDKQNLGNLISDVKYNHHSAEISVIWLVEQSAIKLLILIRYQGKTKFEV